MRVAITGGTGLIGTALTTALQARGDKVLVLTRGRATEAHVTWDPSRGVPNLRRLEGLDAVINLAGAPLAARPWTPHRRQVLRDSRVAATETLLRALSRLDEPPKVFVGAGSLGLFGDHGQGWIDDDQHVGDGFLADLCGEWETAHLLAADVLGSRAAVLRMGVVIASDGGVFPLLYRAFKHGFGGWLGDGRQYTAWISLRDAVGAFLHLLDTPGAAGGFNGSVPDPISNKAWCEALGEVAGHIPRTHAPKWALRGALGELADELLLASCRAKPRKLLETGFHFQDPEALNTFREAAGILDAGGE